MLAQPSAPSRRNFLLSGAGVSFCVLSACSQTSAGWTKYDYNPVLGGPFGTCFDVCLLKFPEGFRMWFSWRPKKSIAWTDSRDGINWLPPRIALAPLPGSNWEQEVNRPVVIADDARGVYRMWYTGQTHQNSAIGYAESEDGISWRRMSENPVLSPNAPWEKVAVMAPHVLWDEQDRIYKMWYSGGDQYEPNAIGYATASDGLNWRRSGDQPVFRPDPGLRWEQDRVTAAQVIKRNHAYYALYIGFRDINRAAIGLAKSPDGLNDWQRHPANPIIRPGLAGWDSSSCYKPFAIYDRNRWLLWYNGRKGPVEQIGLAIHESPDLGL